MPVIVTAYLVLTCVGALIAQLCSSARSLTRLPLDVRCKHLSSYIHALFSPHIWIHIFTPQSVTHNLFFKMLFTLLSLITPLPSRLILHLSSSHTHVSVLFIPLALTLCPGKLNRSMEIDLLKYLLWYLLCDGNSRPFPCKTGKKVNPNSNVCWKKKRQAIKVNFASFEM